MRRARPDERMIGRYREYSIEGISVWLSTDVKSKPDNVIEIGLRSYLLFSELKVEGIDVEVYAF